MPVFYNDQLDDPLMIDGCSSFSGGQVSFQRANILQGNQASKIENFVTSISGELVKRKGSKTLGPGYVGAQDERIQGMLFFDTVGDDKLVAFVGGNAKWYNVNTWDTYFSAGIANINELTSCVQLTDQIYWTDSGQTGIRKWNGTTVSTVAGSPVATTLSVHGTRLIASGISSVPDALDFSDLLDGSTWNSTTQRLRIGGGDGDPIVGHISWQDTGIIVCKRNSVWLIDAPHTAAVSTYSIKSVHSSIGCVSHRTIAQVGQDIWFLSPSGVQSVQKQLATSNNQVTVPVSQAVQDVIRRIRWDYASTSHAIFHNNMYMLSVPVDSNDPDTVLVFDILSGGWSTFSGWSATRFISQPYQGTKRLLYGTVGGTLREWLDYEREDGSSSYAEVEAFLNLSFDLPQDFPEDTEFSSTLTTRALTFSEPLNPKSAFYAELEFVTNDVSFDVYAITDGAPKVLLSSFSNIVPNVDLQVDLPFDFPDAPGWARKRIPLHHLVPFRELQFHIICTQGKLVLREITATAFVDTLELQNY